MSLVVVLFTLFLACPSSAQDVQSQLRHSITEMLETQPCETRQHALQKMQKSALDWLASAQVRLKELEAGPGSGTDTNAARDMVQDVTAPPTVPTQVFLGGKMLRSVASTLEEVLKSYHVVLNCSVHEPDKSNRERLLAEVDGVVSLLSTEVSTSTSVSTQKLVYITGGHTVPTLVSLRTTLILMAFLGSLLGSTIMELDREPRQMSLKMALNRSKLLERWRLFFNLPSKDPDEDKRRGSVLTSFGFGFLLFWAAFGILTRLIHEVSQYSSRAFETVLGDNSFLSSAMEKSWRKIYVCNMGLALEKYKDTGNASFHGLTGHVNPLSQFHGVRSDFFQLKQDSAGEIEQPPEYSIIEDLEVNPSRTVTSSTSKLNDLKQGVTCAWARPMTRPASEDYDQVYRWELPPENNDLLCQGDFEDSVDANSIDNPMFCIPSTTASKSIKSAVDVYVVSNSGYEATGKVDKSSGVQYVMIRSAFSSGDPPAYRNKSPFQSMFGLKHSYNEKGGRDDNATLSCAPSLHCAREKKLPSSESSWDFFTGEMDATKSWKGVGYPSDIPVAMPFGTARYGSAGIGGGRLRHRWADKMDSKNQRIDQSVWCKRQAPIVVTVIARDVVTRRHYYVFRSGCSEFWTDRDLALLPSESLDITSLFTDVTSSSDNMGV